MGSGINFSSQSNFSFFCFRLASFSSSVAGGLQCSPGHLIALAAEGSVSCRWPVASDVLGSFVRGRGALFVFAD